MTVMRQIKTTESISLEEELFQVLSSKNLITEEIRVDALFNEYIENTLDLEKFVQEYLNLQQTVQKLMRYPKNELLQYRILKLLELKEGSTRPKDLVNQLPYARARIHHALNSLQEAGYILKVEKGFYILTDLGRSYLREELKEDT